MRINDLVYLGSYEHPEEPDSESEFEPSQIQLSIREMQYDFENRIAYLEDAVETLRNIIHRYQHLFEQLAGTSTDVEVCPSLATDEP